MSVFTHAEIEYIRSQRLGRVATVGPDGLPHVVPVAFHCNPDTDTIAICEVMSRHSDLGHNLVALAVVG